MRSPGPNINTSTAALRGAVLDGAEVVLCKNGKAEVRQVKSGYRDAERFEVVLTVSASPVKHAPAAKSRKR